MTARRVAAWTALACAGPSAICAARALHHARHGAPILAALYGVLIGVIWIELPALLAVLAPHLTKALGL